MPVSVNVGLSPEQARYVKLRSRNLGRSMSEFVRDLIASDARRVSAERLRGDQLASATEPEVGDMPRPHDDDLHETDPETTELGVRSTRTPEDDEAEVDRPRAAEVREGARRVAG